MPTELGKTYSLDWRGDPPHMLKADVPIWYRFLEKFGSPFLNLYYDCLLGGPFLDAEELKDPYKRDWRILNSKRADAICELTDEVWIIEVAKEPGLRALGQVQTYRALWLRDPKIMKMERPVLVADTINKDLLDAAGMYGVLTFIV
ncbi:hypothetical protein ES702_06765 [subsurface metagenome]